MKKKFLCFLMVFCVIISSICFTATANSTAKINLSENAGNFNISLDGADKYGGELIVAFYDSQNKICQVKNYAAYDGVAYSAVTPADAAKVKAVWVKSFKNLKPLCKPAEANITKENAIEIDASFIDLDNMDIEKKGYIEYYETATSTKATKAYVEASQLKVYLNGVEKADLETALGLCVDQDAVVKLVDNNNDKYYDVVEITIYDYYIITAVDSERKKISFEGYAGQVNVTFSDFIDNEEMTITFKDADGADMTVADFAEGDVVAVVAKSIGKVKPTSINNVVTYYNLGNNSVSGSVTAFNFNYKVLYIDGIAYDVVDFDALYDGFELGAEGTYYLTKTGKIFKYVDTVSSKYVGYVLDACVTDGGLSDDSVQFKLLTADQGIVVFEADSIFEYVKANTESKKDKLTYLADTLEAFYSAFDGTATVADRIVKYTLNSDNKLRSITAFANTGAEAETVTLGAGAKYYPDLGTVGGRKLADGAVLFAIDTYDVNKSYVTTVAKLDEVKTYGGALLTNYNEIKQTYTIGIFDVAQLRGISSKQGIAIAGNIFTTTYKGEQALQVTAYQDNEETPLELFFNDYTIRVVGANSYYSLTDGSVFLYTADDDGYVTDYVVLATMDNKVLTVDPTATTSAAVTTGANGITYSYVGGFVNTFKNGIVTLMDGDAFKADGNMYTYEYVNKRHIITVGDYMSSDSIDQYDAYNNTANYVFMKLANNKVTDIYVIATRVVVPNTNEDETIW